MRLSSTTCLARAVAGLGLDEVLASCDERGRKVRAGGCTTGLATGCARSGLQAVLAASKGDMARLSAAVLA